jgi:UDP-N-acetylglucosamine--N-acetylmuramyl-(pentapeptide) pyrophosphoryl-undecaprenol N-acetylglucosamine transferase
VDERQHRIVFAGGGTGGHLYPALAVAEELRKRPGMSIEFVGARRGVEARLVPEAGYPLRLLRLSGLKGRSAIGSIVSIVAAILAACRCLGWWLSSRPDLVIGVGGYASGPAVLAARILRVKTMVMEQNHYPGATNRALAPRVDRVCVPSESALRRLSGRCVITGNPVRAEFFAIGDPPGGERLSLLIFGGSRGARSINQAMMAALPRLARMKPVPTIVHQCGIDDMSDVETAYRDYPGPNEVRSFLSDMPDRLAAADLVVCRAGASTLSELAAAGRPAILIPYPHAADDHQRHNAEAVEQIGAATIILDPELTGERLADDLVQLTNDPGRRKTMARAARTLAMPDAAKKITDVALELVSGERVDDVS